MVTPTNNTPTNPLAHSLNTVEHSIVEIVTTTVLAGCFLPLAAERLKMTTDAVLFRLSTDPLAHELMSKQLRVKVLLDAYVNMTVITSEVMNGLKDANYSDTVKAMQAYSDLFLDLTRATQNSNLNINVFDKVMAMLPQDVREAVQIAATANNTLPVAMTSDGSTAPLSFKQRPLGRPRRSTSNDNDE